MFIARRVRVAALAFGLLTIPAGVIVGTAGTASAHASCGKTAPDLDNASYGTQAEGANMRSGSSTGCAINAYADDWDILDYHCYTNGNDGYTWTYTRNVTDGAYGWIRDDLLDDNGAARWCGF